MQARPQCQQYLSYLILPGDGVVLAKQNHRRERKASPGALCLGQAGALRNL